MLRGSRTPCAGAHLTYADSKPGVRSVFLDDQLCLYRYRVVYKLPLLGKISELALLNSTNPNTFLVVIVFSVVVCSALSLDQLVNGTLTKPFPKAVVACTLLLAVAGIVCFQFRDFLRTLQLERYEMKNFAIFVLMLTATLFIVRAYSSLKINGSTVCILLTAAAYIDLFIFGHSYNAAPTNDKIPPAPAGFARIQDLKNYRVLGIGGTLPPNTSILYRMSDIRGYGALTPSRYFDFVSKILPEYADFLPILNLQ